jgi:hypothetical protein
MSGAVTGNAPATRSGANGFAIAGLVCGVIGLFLFNFILGPLAIIFGGIGSAGPAGVWDTAGWPGPV